MGSSSRILAGTVDLGPCRSCLRELSLRRVSAACLQSWLPELEPPPPAMRALSLRFCTEEVEGVAAALEASCLTPLEIQGSWVRELPPGGYLQSLEELNLQENRLTEVPPALAAATRLRRLDLRGNSMLRLDAAGLALLSGLPQLEWHGLDKIQLTSSTDTELGSSGDSSSGGGMGLEEVVAALPGVVVELPRQVAPFW